VLKSALGNADDRRAPNLGGLRVIDARIDGGPAVKRVRPGARGMAHVIKKRMAHIKVTIE
jgi:large subunit ribosomal protein L22